MELIRTQRVRKDFAASPNDQVAFTATIEGENITLGVSGTSGGAQITFALTNLESFLEFARAVSTEENMVQ